MYTLLLIYLNMYIPFYSMHLTVYIVRCGIGICIYEYITIASNPIMSPVSWSSDLARFATVYLPACVKKICPQYRFTYMRPWRAWTTPSSFKEQAGKSGKHRTPLSKKASETANSFPQTSIGIRASASDRAPTRLCALPTGRTLREPTSSFFPAT